MNTITAISTPYGVGGIAVIRVSGAEAVALCDAVFRGRKTIAEARPSSILYGDIVSDGETLDEVLVSVFRAPHSFTGEDVVEIACHGSLYIQQSILNLLLEKGCRMAEAGEFTRRAFLNGRMDLSEAEAVADLISAQSRAEKDLALRQLRGGISTELASLRERLLKFTSLIELELDFADHEDLEFVDRSELHTLADDIYHKLTSLCDSFRTGNAIRGGIRVAIVGATNAGKSTLLNALLGEERAIVSDVHGTTRDTVEDTFVLDGVLLRLIDTAGIRDTADTVEALGIERSRKALAEAGIVLQVVDATRPETDVPLVPEEGQILIKAYNKSDLCASVSTTSVGSSCTISAKQGDIASLLSALREAVQSITARLHGVSVCISNARHYEALCRAKEAIERVQTGLNDGISGEFLSMDLQDCLAALGEVTGQITSQDVLNNIFSKFCIGK